MNSYDVTIVGGGIVGLATGLFIGRRFPQYRVLILEKESQPAFHQTGHNSGVIHSGVYYKPGSFKSKFTKLGNQSMVDFCREYQLPYDVCGKVIVATKDDELPFLENLFQRGLQNGLAVKKLRAEEVKKHEPYVKCLAGIYVPTAGIVDYKKVCQKYAELIERQGGELRFNHCVQGIKTLTNSHEVETNRGIFSTRFLVNCGGLQSDRLARMAGIKTTAKIVPFRGEYYELRPEKRYLVKGLIYPVPNPAFPFLGVHFTRMIDGSVHAGPNAVLSLKREGYKKTDFDLGDFAEVMAYPGFWKLVAKHWQEGFQEVVRSFSKAAFVRSLQQLIPEVTADDIVTNPAGVRAQALKNDGTLVEDFLSEEGPNSLQVLNAP
ncbi:MAG: L-2-hydroxyglutarate oxidase, partial [Synechocystis sp.]